MSSDPRIERLLEEMLESDCTPEEVCRDVPELVGAVRERWLRVRRLQGEVDALFPSPSAAPRESASTATSHELPEVPGYDVQSELGRGGVGVVYRAWHVRLNRAVALKMLLAGEFALSHELARFAREAEVIAGLKHPSIVQVHDVGDYRGRPYFTMELLDGGTLAKKISGTPLSALEAAALMIRLAEAIHAAHVGGVVHRDLKPSNVLFAADGTPKITDFGLARRLDGATALTQSGVTVGTPSYMAPEQARGDTHAVGPAADVYALGAILYEMLTGRPPFCAATPLETQRQVIGADPVPPSRLAPSVGRDLETISLKCLEKEPARRYESAAAMAEDLRRFVRAEPILARPISNITRVAKWVRRRPALASLAAGGALLLVAALCAALWISSQRTVLARAVDEDLVAARGHLRSADWSGARTAIERARGRLGSSAGAGSSALVDGIDRDVTLAMALGENRLRRIVPAGRGFDNESGDREYARLFEQHGIGVLGDAPAIVAERVRASLVKEALITALDDWALCAVEDVRAQWALAVAREADPDPEWRDVVRDLSMARGPGELQALADRAQVAAQPVSVLLVLANRMRGEGLDASGFMRRVQFAHAADFWANFQAAVTLDERGDPDAIGGYLAALAIRPDSIAVLVNLGTALAIQDRSEDALEYFERALALDPTLVMVQANYAAALLNAQDYDRAVEHAREAIRIDPTLTPAYGPLCQGLWRLGRYAEALEVARRMLELATEAGPLRDSARWLIENCEQRMSMLERLPALLDGSEQPESPAETVQFAQFCKSRGMLVESARLFEKAFAEEPELADDILSGNRLMAAQVAAELAWSTGTEDVEQDPDAQAVWRARSHRWLEDEIALWASSLATADPRIRWELRRRVILVRESPSLARFAPAELSKLHAAEREDWMSLWRDLDALEHRIDRTK